MRNSIRVLFILCCGFATNFAVAAALTAVEYDQGSHGQYFLTASPQEIAALDAGMFPGWSRTGESFAVFPLDTAGAANVCRFWGGQNYSPKSSHFYTPLASECAIVKGDAGWQFEGEAFAVMLPEATGACAGATVPLYRLHNRSQNGAPDHRYTTRLTTQSEMLAQGWIAEGYGIGVIGCVPLSSEPETIAGHVIDGYIERALVCIDVNRNGRCDASEAQAYTDATGAYQLTIPRDSTASLVAEVIAGLSRDGEQPQTTVDVSYRMASPSRAYSTDITPFSTLVQLTGQSDYRLAEDLVRGVLGLPPYYDIKLSAPAAPGSLKQMVGNEVVFALKANGMTLDLTAPDALARVAATFPAALANVPQLRITTKDGTPIVSKVDYVDATYVLINHAAAVPTVALNGKIRGRGHSTWGQPKNPYKVQFTNDASYAAITDVLGMRKQRNWALLADYFDRSLIRNKLALSLGSSSVFADGLKWTPSGQHLEVYLNDDYVGVYLMTEDIRIDPARLNIKKMSSNPATDDVDGGYIVEVDIRLDCYKDAELDLQLKTPKGVPFCIDTPDEESITPKQLSYVKNLLVQVETDIYGPHSLERINPASFADWYLLQELFRNTDALFISSDYMWKDARSAAYAADQLLNMGPLWDFDRSAGNNDGFDNWKSEGCWVSKPELPNWISKLLENPDFLALTLARWKEKRPALETFVNVSIDTFARRLAVAQQRNFQRWPIFDVQLTNHYVFANYAEEVAFVRRFLVERLAWLDKAYASPEAFNALCK
jgi:hypothetical protein